MPVYRMTKDALEALPETGFQARGIKERADLQRLLRANITPVAPDVLVIAEEFSEWDDSKRRIDLLGVDRDADLVVIELKRDDEGGHMELQAIRYAAMVSTMTFARAVEVYQSFLEQRGDGNDAQAGMLEFLGWDEPQEDEFGQDVKIVLVAADFSKELTTSVLWINKKGLDVRCVRMKPYLNGDVVIVDAQQVVPLPEAEEYTVQIREKERAVQTETSGRHALRLAFWRMLLPVAAIRTPRFARRSPSETNYLSVPSGVPGMKFNYQVAKNNAECWLYIDKGVDGSTWNKAVYDYLHERRERIEQAHGNGLRWNRLDEKRASIISDVSVEEGIRSPKDRWPAIGDKLIDAMVRFEKALLPHMAAAAAHADKMMES